MDYKPQPAFKGNSYGYKKKRCMWFNSAFMDDITFANGKIIDMTFNVPPFQIYNPNNLKVISYIRDDANTKPIVIKMKEPYLTNRSVINTDKEAFPLIYSNHTGVEGMTSMSPKFTLNPQQISRFVFKIDESLNNRDGLTVNETIIQSTTTVSIKSSEYSINYEPFKHIKSGTYTATFSGGNINFNGINDTSYPLLKDGSGITINPMAWYKFDSGGLINDASGNGYNLSNSNSVTINTTDFIKGNGSAGFAGNNYFQYNNGTIFNPSTFSLSFWAKLPSAGVSNYQGIASIRGVGTSYLGKGWTIYLRNDNGNLELWTYDSTNNYNTVLVSSYYTNNNNIWRHFALSIARTTGTNATFKFYFNGVLTVNTTITYIEGSVNNFRIGEGSTETTPNFLVVNNSRIDDFRFYSGMEFTQTQVSELYNGRLSIYNPPSFELGIELEDTNLTKDNIASIYR